MFDANGGAEKDVNNRVKIAWSKWRETTGVMCDRYIPTKLKDKVYKTAIKPAMVYGAECWAVRKKEVVHLPLLYLQCVNPEMFFTARFFNGNVMCMV